jgi:hypothetical protein
VSYLCSLAPQVSAEVGVRDRNQGLGPLSERQPVKVAANLHNPVVGSTAMRVMAHASCPVERAGPRPKPELSYIIEIEPPCADCLDASSPWSPTSVRISSS